MIGRKREIAELNKLCDSKESKLVAVYGRRRIGKTYLIDSMFKEHRKDCMFFDYTGDYDGDNKVQLENFRMAIYEWFKVQCDKFENWTEAFNFLRMTIDSEIKNTNHEGKVVIFIDEIPWVDKTNKNGFLSAFGTFWNTYCVKRKNVVLIMCGSNASWIKNKILEDGIGPHHKRVDAIIPLQPFTLEETAEYLKEEKKLEIDSKTITEIYMIFGGVAKYLSFYDSDLSLAENVNKIFFNIHGLLFGEYEILFKSLFQDRSAMHKNIMDFLCTKRSGYESTEIAEKLQVLQSDKSFRKALDELMTCGFITAMPKLFNDTKNAKYIVADPFCLFYKFWVEPLSRNQIAKLNDYWNEVMSGERYPKWTGFSFEMVCILNIELYLKQRGMEGTYKSVRYWNFVKKEDSDPEDKGAQIDLLVEYQNNVYDIVECKYSNDIYVLDQSDAAKLKNKKAMFIKHALTTKKYDIKTVMLTTYGTKKNNSHYSNIPINKEISLQEMLG